MIAFVVFVSGCGTMNMRKIVVEPKIPQMSMERSSLRAGLVLDDKITNYKYSFSTSPQLLYLSSVEGEVEIGKNLSQGIYSIISTKFGNVILALDAKELTDYDLYLVPDLKLFSYSPPFTGYSSHTAEIILETKIYDRKGQLQGSFIIKQSGSRSAMKQVLMESNYDGAQFAVNEAINNFFVDFAKKIDDLY